jgi:hypothetical protein
MARGSEKEWQRFQIHVFRSYVTFCALWNIQAWKWHKNNYLISLTSSPLSNSFSLLVLFLYSRLLFFLFSVSFSLSYSPVISIFLLVLLFFLLLLLFLTSYFFFLFFILLTRTTRISDSQRKAQAVPLPNNYVMTAHGGCGRKTPGILNQAAATFTYGKSADATSSW